MRPDQEEMLKDLAAKLVDRVLVDCDPDNWSGDKAIPKDMTADQRGDAHWCAKYASQLLSVTTRVVLLTERGNREHLPVEPSESEIRAAAEEAERTIARALGR